jgi:hypothetical protein
MSSVGFLGAMDRPAEVGWRSEESRSDLELPGWDEFTTARDRFFARLERLHAETLAPQAEAAAVAVRESI